MSSSHRRLALALSGFLLLAVLLAGGPLPAGAQDAPAVGTDSPEAKGPARSEWALTPTGDNPAEPGSRPNLSYELAPGASMQDSVTVWNYSDNPLTFRIYARDAFNTPAGGFDLLRRDQQSTDAGSWITLEQNSMIVPPHSGIASKLTISVPADASPGDHAAGIVAAIESPGSNGTDDGNDVLVEHRAGSRVYVRVAGPLNPSLVIDSLHAQYHRSLMAVAGGDLDVTYVVRNAGNVRLSAHQVIEATGPFGIGLGDDEPDDVPELLPGSSITLTGRVTGVLPLVRVSGTVKLDPFSADGPVDPAPEDVARASSSWAIPWLFLALVVVLFVALRMIRRRRRASGPGGSRGGRRGRGPGGPGPSDPTGSRVQAPVDRAGRRLMMGRGDDPSSAWPMALVAVAVLACGTVVPSGPAMAAAPDAATTRVGSDAAVTVAPSSARVGSAVVVSLTGWPAGVVTVAVCGDSARRGSNDCDQIGSHGVGIPASGTGSARLVVAPPVGCPCVVRVSTPSSDLVRTIPIEVPRFPTLRPDELGPELLPTAVGALEVSTHLENPARGDLALSAVMGGPVDRVLVLVVRNAGPAPLAGVTVSAAVGHDREHGSSVAVPRIGTLAPLEEQTLRVAVTIGAPAVGHYLVFGRVDSMAGAASFEAATDTRPWGAVAVAALVLVVLVARSVRRRRRSRRRSGLERVEPSGLALAPEAALEPLLVDASN